MVDYYAKREQWNAISPGYANVSHYIYHDLNGQGNYDVMAKAMMMVAVKITKPDGSYQIRRSNLNGFVNFLTSVVTPTSQEPYHHIDVKRPGEYVLEVMIPEGWYATSGNAIQKLSFIEAPHTRAGIICVDTPDPVGLAQKVTVSGKVHSSHKNQDAQTEITAFFDDGTTQNVPIKNGQYLLDMKAYKGNLTLLYKFESKTIQKSLAIGMYPIKVSTVSVDQACVPLNKAAVTVVDFENITLGPILKVPNGVAGINWKNLIVTDNKFYNGEGYHNGTISGKYVGYNTSGYPVTLEWPDGFDFYGGYFSVAWLGSAEGESLLVEVWRGENKIAMEEYELSALGPFYLDAKWGNVTKIIFSTKHYWQFIVDDLKIGV